MRLIYTIAGFLLIFFSIVGVLLCLFTGQLGGLVSCFLSACLGSAFVTIRHLIDDVERLQDRASQTDILLLKVDDKVEQLKSSA